ncbi:hypothetical protein, partial [Kitasatospora aureofaciens]|uniref:hypothetical protein n=1 Tax=Kitasatospora aureofaciens TaxID=1894 RepID=UPI0035217158
LYDTPQAAGNGGADLPPWSRPPVLHGGPGLAPALWSGAALATGLAVWGAAGTVGRRRASARSTASAAPAAPMLVGGPSGVGVMGIGSTGVGSRSHRRLARRTLALLRRRPRRG